MLKTKVINTNTNDVHSAELSPRSAQQAECLIGRHPNCDLILDGPAVSRVHGRILFESGRCFFTDLGSTDGSRLNNEAALVNRGYAIAPDDVIRIGEFALIVEDFQPAQSTTQTAGDWSDDITARCMQIIQETHDIKTFRFIAMPERLFSFKPGQFVTLQAPIDGESNPPVTRSYSISSSPSRPHTLDITVKRVGAASGDLPAGVVSNWLHDCFEVGMTLQMQGPFGQFNCMDYPADKLLLISAGSGITPMMSISQWLSDRAENTDITFIHAARTPHDLVFRQRLDLLVAQHPHFKLAFTLTKETPAIPWSGYRGRLNPALLSAICPDFAERTAFVCGPAGFMNSTKALLEAEGFPMKNYHEESFGGSKTAPSVSGPKIAGSNVADHNVAEPTISAAGDEPSVTFSVSGQAIACDESDTLLDAAEQAGVSMPSGCRMGSCGMCKQKAQGEVCYDVEPRGLGASDRTNGHVLTCIAKPVGHVVLAL